jgi:agmatinase
MNRMEAKSSQGAGRALTHVPYEPFLSFMGQPVETDLARLDAEFAVLGAPFGSPYHMQGVASDAAAAPRAVRERSHRFGRMLGHFDFDFDEDLFGGRHVKIVDCGDVIADPRELEDNKARVTEAVMCLLDRGAVPIVLGGDDSVPPLVIGALERHAPVTVLQFDAHLDYRDEVNGITDGYSSPMRRAAEMPWVERIVHVGLRGLGSAGLQDVADSRANGNALVLAKTVKEKGIGVVLDEFAPGANVFVTLDCDGFDPAVMPGTSCPMPGGLDYWEGADIIAGVAAKCNVVGMDYAEHFPSLDFQGITSLTLGRLIATLIGTMIRKD